MKEEFKNEEVRQMKKGQASIEFLALFIAMMMFVLILYAGSLNRINEVSTSSSQQEIKATCDNTASLIDNALYFGSGFSTNTTVYGNYTLRVFNKTLICYSGNSYYINGFAAANVKNSTGYSEFSIQINLQKTLKIENQGAIVIS